MAYVSSANDQLIGMTVGPLMDDGAPYPACGLIELMVLAPSFGFDSKCPPDPTAESMHG